MSIITGVLEQHNRDYWIEKFTGLGCATPLLKSYIYWADSQLYSIPFGPINNIQETFKHPQAIARGSILEVDVCVVIAPPIGI